MSLTLSHRNIKSVDQCTMFYNNNLFWNVMLCSSLGLGTSVLLKLKIKCTLTVSLVLVFAMFLHRYPQSWRATRASDQSCCTRGWTTPSCGRLRHWRGTSGAWSRRYAAHHPRQRSSCQDLFPRIDKDTIGLFRLVSMIGHDRFALNEWLLSWCKDQKLLG